MKRFHVHLHVSDLAASLAFYNKLFAAEPARVEADYAKWMLTDPPVNFAISTRGAQPGLDHLGIQVDNADDLTALKAQAQAADMALLDEGETTCCYARSDKYWVTDPQGVAWEQFHTLGNIPTFSVANTEANLASAQACCAPAATKNENTASACCTPAVAAQSSAGGCCAPAQPAAVATGGCCGPRSAPDAAAASTAAVAMAGGCCAPTAKQGCC
jgi:catechol 2,3-dioxygenase-like lactoylglutathione lyase family enzyme